GFTHSFLYPTQLAANLGTDILDGEHPTDFEVGVDPRREPESSRITVAYSTIAKLFDPGTEAITNLGGKLAWLDIDALRHLLAQHFTDARFRQHPLAVPFTLGQQHAHKTRVVVECRHRTARNPRHVRRTRFRTDRLQRAKLGIAHAKAIANALSKQLVPVLASGTHRRHRDDLEADTAVQECCSWIGTHRFIRSLFGKAGHVPAMHALTNARRQTTD